jgi:SAM-dependent methyltransferase
VSTLSRVTSILGIPTVYRLFGTVIGGSYRDRYVREFIQPRSGDRVLDIGCGPGDMLAHLPPVEYVGIDLAARYIETARQRFGTRGEFHCESATETVLQEPGSFDIVMANGLLHHLSDDEARKVLSLARQALKPTGKFIALDGAFVADQSGFERLLLKLDRGRFVRAPEDYVRLARETFGDVQGRIYRDLLRWPYTHHIMTCRP